MPKPTLEQSIAVRDAEILVAKWMGWSVGFTEYEMDGLLHRKYFLRRPNGERVVSAMFSSEESAWQFYYDAYSGTGDLFLSLLMVLAERGYSPQIGFDLCDSNCWEVELYVMLNGYEQCIHGSHDTSAPLALLSAATRLIEAEQIKEG